MHFDFMDKRLSILAKRAPPTEVASLSLKAWLYALCTATCSNNPSGRCLFWGMYGEDWQSHDVIMVWLNLVMQPTSEKDTVHEHTRAIESLYRSTTVVVDAFFSAFDVFRCSCR